MSEFIAHFNMHGYVGYIITAYAITGCCLLGYLYRVIRRSKYVKKVIAARYGS